MRNTRRKQHVLPVVLLTVICLAVFANSMPADFLWDDYFLIQENQYVRSIRHIPLFFTPHYYNHLHPFHPNNDYRPVRDVSFALDYSFWGLNPVGFQATNVLLHLINILLVYGCACRLAGVRGREPALARGNVVITLPFLAALFFAVHPVHTEAICFTKNRSELLAFLFFQTSFLLFLSGRSLSSGKCRQTVTYIAMPLCFALAMGAKEMAITLPLIIILYAACFLPGQVYATARKMIPLVFLLILFYWFTGTALTAAGFSAGVENIGAREHGAVIFKTLGWYLKMLVLPLNLNAEHFFEMTGSWLDAEVMIPILVVSLTAALIINPRTRSKLPVFGLAWILITLIPVSNIIILQGRPVAEQRLYLPSFGFCLVLASGIMYLDNFLKTRFGGLTPPPAKRLSLGAAMIIAVFFSVQTVQRNLVWRDSVTLYADAVAKSPESARARANLGYALAREGKMDESIRHYRTAVRLAPDKAKYHNDLALALVEKGDRDDAIVHFQAALRSAPDYAMAHNNLGNALFDAGRPEQARHHYRTALRLQPDLHQAHANLGAVLFREGRLDEAARHYQTALELAPETADYHYSLGTILSARRHPDKAADHYKKALQLNPDCVNTRINLGVALAESGHPDEAVRHYRAALDRDPDSVIARNNLGNTLLDLGRPEQAIKQYKMALRLNPDDAYTHNNLGTAYLKSDRPDKAIHHYRLALELEPEEARFLDNLAIALEAKERREDAGGTDF